VSVVKSTEYIACILGEDLVNQQGRNPPHLRSLYQGYGGEKCCVARHTHGHGFAPLSRGSSFVILRYIREPDSSPQ